MILVTGGAGFIGSNIVKALNNMGREDIIIVDKDLGKNNKFKNLIGLKYLDFIDRRIFLSIVNSKSIMSEVDLVIHQGACSDTTQTDSSYIMDTNYDFSKMLLYMCIEYNIDFIYASSAATYGLSTDCKVNPDNEFPLNIYGFSKLAFDEFVRRQIKHSSNKIIGLRYFNVYGPGEQHKGRMASVPYHMYKQIQENHQYKLFEGSDNFKRDFIYIDDVVKVTLFFAFNKDVIQGIFNCGTGIVRSFKEMGNIVETCFTPSPLCEIIPFPNDLEGKYQTFTKADISPLRDMGYRYSFTTLEDGIMKYYSRLKKENVQ